MVKLRSGIVNNNHKGVFYKYCKTFVIKIAIDKVKSIFDGGNLIIIIQVNWEILIK